MDKQSAEMTVFYYLKLLYKWKIQILVVVITSVTITSILGLRAPRTYTATATFLRPYSNTSVASSIAKNLGIPNLNTRPLDASIILAMIHSRRMSEKIAERFFYEKWTKADPKTRETLRRMVRGMINVFLPRGEATGYISVTTFDPKLAADIANFCMANLDNINAELNITPERPMVKVVDAATPPPWPSSRRIIKKVVIAAILSSGSMLCMVFSIDYYKRIFKKSVRDSQG